VYNWAWFVGFRDVAEQLGIAHTAIRVNNVLCYTRSTPSHKIIFEYNYNLLLTERLTRYPLALVGLRHGSSSFARVLNELPLGVLCRDARIFDKFIFIFTNIRRIWIRKKWPYSSNMNMNMSCHIHIRRIWIWTIFLHFEYSRIFGKNSYSIIETPRSWEQDP
jgi:hypothetical protein